MNYKKKTLLVHIGYPKTATTTLQENLIFQLSQKNKIGYLCHSINIKRKNNLKSSILINNIYEYIISNKLDKIGINIELEKIKKSNFSNFVISAETISHITENNIADRSYTCESIHNNPRRIHKIFKNIFDEIKILIVIRSSKDFSYSIYKEWYPYIINTSNIKNYNDWCSQFLKISNIKRGFLNYAKMISNYSKIFGKNKVITLFYEDLINDKIFFYKKISFLFNINVNQCRFFLETNKKNIKDSYFFKRDLSTLISKYIAPFLRKKLNSNNYNYLKKIYYNNFNKILKLFYLKKKFLHDRDFNESIIKKKFIRLNYKLLKFKLSKKKLKKYEYI